MLSCIVVYRKEKCEEEQRVETRGTVVDLASDMYVDGEKLKPLHSQVRRIETVLNFIQGYA